MNIKKKISHLYRTHLINWINKFIVERAWFKFRVVRAWKLPRFRGVRTPYWVRVVGAGVGRERGRAGRGTGLGFGTGRRNLYTYAVLCTIIIS